MNDLKFALRQLLKNPGFALVCVLTLALGLSNATSNFSFLNALLINGDRFVRAPAELVVINRVLEADRNDEQGISTPDFLDLREGVTALTGVFAYEQRTVIVGGGELPQRVLGTAVSAGAFDVLGTAPLHGRLFRPEEDQPGAAPAVLLSHDLWQEQFGGRMDLLGQTILLNGSQHLVAGVMPPRFGFPTASDLWLPLKPVRKESERLIGHGEVFGRMAPGVTLDRLNAELGAFAAHVAREHPATAGRPLRAEGLLAWQRGDNLGTLMLTLQGATLAVLLIACGNIANLFLTRSLTRQREFAVRAALGASRWGILSVVLGEGVVIAVAGGALGVAWAFHNVNRLVRAIPVDIPYWIDVSPHWRVFVFAFIGAGIAAIFFSLLPAWHVSRPDVNVALQEGARGQSGGRRTQRLRQTLVALQVAGTLVLLVAAGLMTQAFFRARYQPLGVDTSQLLTFRVGLPGMQFSDGDADRFFRELPERLREIPGVTAAGLMSHLPASGSGFDGYEIEGQTSAPRASDAPQVETRVATPGLPETLKMSLSTGRWFDVRDTTNSPRVCVIDETMAARAFPGASPIGRRVRLVSDTINRDAQPEWLQIVGVVSPVRSRIHREIRPALWTPASQSGAHFLSGLVRVNGDPARQRDAVQAAVLRVQGGVPIYDVRTLEKRMEQVTWEDRFFGELFLRFGIQALFLAGIGLYGVMAYGVQQRSLEFGIRLALGAQPAEIMTLVVRGAVPMVLAGLGLGAVGALGIGRLLQAAERQVSAVDPWILLSVSMLLTTVIALACWLPARRAARVDPVTALRAD
jgi:putative ABC transport system permease protein